MVETFEVTIMGRNADANVIIIEKLSATTDTTGPWSSRRVGEIKSIWSFLSSPIAVCII